MSAPLDGGASTREPLVAIVTPVYNGEAYLEETMACVQAQTYPRLVHVVSDNASTDRTAAILKTFEGGRVPLIVARQNATVPPAQNWNAAFDLVPPEAGWFRLLCADDTMAPTAIERKISLALSDPAIGVVGCHWRATGLCGSELPETRSVYPGRDILRLYFDLETSVLSGMFCLIRCDLARARRPLYDGSIRGFDTDATLGLLQRASFGLVHEELVTWRRHTGSISGSLRREDLVNKAEWLTLLDRYGPANLGDDGYRIARKAFRRHYLRKLLQLLAGRDLGLFRQHLADLSARGDPADLWHFGDALFDWIKLALTRRRTQVARSASLR